MTNLFTVLAGAAEEAHHYSPPTAIWEPTGWVSLAMLVLIGIILWKKIPATISANLDKRIGEIQSELDEAKDLRVEAEKLRAEYESKLASASTEADEIRARADEEATRILDDAKESATHLIARRKQMAEEKIAAAEREAMAEIQNLVARTATQSAQALIASHHSQKDDEQLVNEAIAKLN